MSAVKMKISLPARWSSCILFLQRWAKWLRESRARKITLFSPIFIYRWQQVLPVYSVSLPGSVHLHRLQWPLHVLESRAADNAKWSGKREVADGWNWSLKIALPVAVVQWNSQLGSLLVCTTARECVLSPCSEFELLMLTYSGSADNLWLWRSVM